mmetsp:Transcript_5021/g.16754  ORF Transcript_5021/g.16754 Transcript_5021/m.16754 type:complete len:230 (-) Transcript_5021:300-989(-)
MAHGPHTSTPEHAHRGRARASARRCPSQHLQVYVFELWVRRAHDVLQPVYLDGESREEEDGGPLEESLRVLLRLDRAARLVHLTQVVVRGEVLVREQLRVEVDLGLEARALRPHQHRLDVLHRQDHLVRLERADDVAGAARHRLAKEGAVPVQEGSAEGRGKAHEPPPCRGGLAPVDDEDGDGAHQSPDGDRAGGVVDRVACSQLEGWRGAAPHPLLAAPQEQGGQSRA